MLNDDSLQLFFGVEGNMNKFAAFNNEHLVRDAELIIIRNYFRIITPIWGVILQIAVLLDTTINVISSQ